MKKTQVVVVMLVLSLFTGIASADASEYKHEEKHEITKKNFKEYKVKEEGEVKEVKYEVKENKTKVKYEVKERYKEIKESHEKFKERYENAKENFRSLKNRVSKERLINKTREYLENAVELMIAHLEVVKSRIEEINQTIPFDATANINQHIAKLEELRIKIQQAESPQELSDTAKQLRDTWINIKLESQYYIGMVINNGIDNFLTKTRDVSQKMENIIQELKDEGKDTSELEEAVSNFNELVNEAQESYEHALELYEEHEGFDSNGIVIDAEKAHSFLREAHELQKETHKKLKKASKELRHFFKEVDKLKHGKRVYVWGTGTLEASGNGRAFIEGNLTATVSGNGTLIVSGNSKVTTNGTGTRRQLGNGNVKYQGYGIANITGDNIRISVSGNNISLTVTGTGYALLHGNGTYSTKGNFSVRGEWKEE